MPVGDRNKKGFRTDLAKHYSYSDADTPICGNKRYGYSSNDITNVDCKKCLNKLTDLIVKALQSTEPNTKE